MIHFNYGSQPTSGGLSLVNEILGWMESTTGEQDLIAGKRQW
jgi:hypothetical protein